jgi:TIR domain
MTPSIFLSWSSPDKDLVLPLRDRLRDVGLTLWEYSEDMPAGVNIHADIIKAINQVEVALICFTDATADRQWIVRESEWSFKTRTDGDKPLRHIIPVWVGPHPANKVPAILRENHFKPADLANSTDQALAGFVTHLFEQLGQQAPRVVPAALFAMTHAQCQALLADPDKAKSLADLCLTGGMIEPPPIADTILRRYGARPQDLEPFEQGQSLVTTINATLRKVNARRVALNRRPLFLRWMNDLLVGPNRQQDARNEWAAGDSLLIVDSMSTLDSKIAKALPEMPQPKHPERAALLWLPPYTQHAVTIEKVLQTLALTIPQLGDAFEDWAKASLRAMAFDTATPAGTRLWLLRSLLDMEDESSPLDDNVAAMHATASARISLNEVVPRPGPL